MQARQERDEIRRAKEAVEDKLAGRALPRPLPWAAGADRVSVAALLAVPGFVPPAVVEALTSERNEPPPPHLRVEAGTNAHHMIEAAFKAFARALRAAVALDPDESGVPSTKGTLTG